VECTAIERVGTISEGAFVAEYKHRGRPVVLSEVTASWPAREKWSVEYLKRVAGDRRVPLYDTRGGDGRRHQHAAATHMRLGEYVDRLRAGEKDLRIFFFNLLREAPELRADFVYPHLGMRFVDRLSVLFMGGKGARVQMHFDADLADIVLCHFGGKKRVIVFGPEETPYLYRVPFSFSALYEVRPDAPDYARYPALRHARGRVAELGHGDVLYIPPGHWHYVLYDEIGFSLSLRALPRNTRHIGALVYNIAVLRTCEAMMRKLFGQRWIHRNERVAIERTHRRLRIGAGEPSGRPA
jgi:cupin-like protein